MIRKANSDDLGPIERLGPGVSKDILLNLNSTFVADDSGEVVGVAVAISENGIHYIGSLVVRGDRRGSGVGKSLLEYVQNSVGTPIVVIAKDDVVGFYRKIGFTSCGTVMERST